jgi:hypothetical protein
MKGTLKRSSNDEERKIGTIKENRRREVWDMSYLLFPMKGVAASCFATCCLHIVKLKLRNNHSQTYTVPADIKHPRLPCPLSNFSLLFYTGPDTDKIKSSFYPSPYSLSSKRGILFE